MPTGGRRSRAAPPITTASGHVHADFSASPPPHRPDADPKPARDGAIFHALLDAGVAAKVAYTAEKRLHTTISETVAPQFRSLTAEMSRRFDEIDRRFDERDRKLDGLAEAGAARDRRLDEHDRKLDEIIARLDRFILAGKIMLGAHALLIAVLVVVFGLLVTKTN